VSRAATALVTMALLVGACGNDGEDAAGDGGQGRTTTTMATGGIEIDAPDGWLAVPLPDLAFGVAIPEGWEAVRLDEEGLASLGRASPVVPGFAAAAHNAARSGSVLYAAGVDDTGAVIDLKVRADIRSEVSDAAGLEAYARDLANQAGLVDPRIEAVADASRPTVELRFETTSQRPAEESESDGDGDDAPDELVDVAVIGTERLVLGPNGVVYDLILTSEDGAGHDALAATLLPTLAFPPS
jgi:hypothetical protein